jgi:AAA domain
MTTLPDNAQPGTPTPDPTIAELMEFARGNPSRAVIEDLLNESETAGLHGSPGAFKTMFCLQLMESLATAQPLLGICEIPKPRKVYFVETEMSAGAMGKRLLKMFDGTGKDIPELVQFASEAHMQQFKRALGISAKFDLLKQWVTDAEPDVVIIDTVNVLFRGRESGSEETAAGEFFDRLAELPAAAKIFVRHNRKHYAGRDDKQSQEPADDSQEIKGSGQFSEVPDLLMQLTRKDKRTHEASLSLTKYRHGDKPPAFPLWFNSGDFRMTSLPPVIDLLKCGPARSREQLLEMLEAWFDVSHALGDALIVQVRDFLAETYKGHSKVYSIDPEAAKGADWYPRYSGGFLQ